MAVLERRFAFLESKATASRSIYSLSSDELESRVRQHFGGRMPTHDELLQLAEQGRGEKVGLAHWNRFNPSSPSA